MNPLMQQLATNAGDYAVGKYGMHLPKGRQLALWKRYYDSTLAALMAYEDITRARSIRARSFISEN